MNVCSISPGLRSLLNVRCDYAAEHQIVFSCNKIVGILFHLKIYKHPDETGFSG